MKEKKKNYFELKTYRIEWIVSALIELQSFHFILHFLKLLIRSE